MTTIKARIILGSIALGIVAFTSFEAAARPPALVDPQTGKYLGDLSSNPYDPNSVGNRFGRYGSPYSPDSINNPHGQYGSRYSPNSPNNPYASSYGGGVPASSSGGGGSISGGIPARDNRPPVALPGLPGF